MPRVTDLILGGPSQEKAVENGVVVAD